MTDPNGGGNKTVFRPSPLQGLRQGQPASPPPPPQGWGAPAASEPANWGTTPPPASGFDTGYADPPSMSRQHAPEAPALQPSRLGEDDVPLPATPREVRNVMLAEAGPVLALAAGVRAGRVRTPLPQFHRQAMQAIATFDRAVQQRYPEETRQRAKYALCATIDDIAQNLPGQGADGAQWAQRSMVVSFFRENIGGDRFWQLVDDMLRDPSNNADLIELYHACLAAGFEGRFRVMPDGKRRLHEIMARLQGALTHVRSLSMMEMSPRWKGETAPIAKVGFWTYIAVAAAAGSALLLLSYIVLRLILMSAGEAPSDKLAGAFPDDRLRLSREGGAVAAPADSAQAAGLKRFLAPEIERGEVVVIEDAQTVRVRTTVGQLFKSGSDELEPERVNLFSRIGEAINGEPGAVTIEGHADSDRIASLAFPDNTALSQARADKVAGLIRGKLADGNRVTAKGMGDSVPIASNDTAEGKTQNRRVEAIVPRRY